MNSISELQAVIGILFLLGGVVFNLGIWSYKFKDIEKRLSISSKRIGAIDNRLNRLINRGNRKLNWDFEWENDGDNDEEDNDK